MRIGQDVIDVTGTSAREAVRLYFEPVRRVRMLRPLFGANGYGLSSSGRLTLSAVALVLVLGVIWARPEVSVVITDIKGQESVSIQAPLNGSMAYAQEVVTGRASRSAETVWIVVRPVNMATYFVQGPAVAKNGNWSGVVSLGTAAPNAGGEAFEILALADPSATLQRGQILDRLPEAKAVSKVIVLRRR